MNNSCRTWTKFLLFISLLFLLGNGTFSLQIYVTEKAEVQILQYCCNSHSMNVSTLFSSKTCSSISYNDHSGEFLSDFIFPRRPVVNVNCFHDELLKWVNKRQPVLLKNCAFFKQALKWDLDYLAKGLTDEYAVSFSDTRQFLYYDTQQDYGLFRNAGWTPPYHVRYMSFKDFLKVAKELGNVNNGSHAYFQTLLLNEDRNSSVKHDLNNFDYSWLVELAFRLGWRTNVINMLFVGMPSVFTHAHYDMMENLFIQIKGKKRFILFSPEQFSKLYPYPVGHPHDRQSQVDFNNPDYKRFPKFRSVDALEAIVEPGDLLYVPLNWWHHVESYQTNFTVSMNFWFENDMLDRITNVIKESVSSQQPVALQPSDDLAFKRYLETLAYNVTKSLPKVRQIFEDIVNDRFTT